MHFDSDDEGQNGIRNPLISTILYIHSPSTHTPPSFNKSSSNTSKKTLNGGPSLVTTQKLRDHYLAERGYLSFPNEKRLVAFNGKVLHGVIPGKGIPVQTTSNHARRVTLMMAFWKHIDIRHESTFGSARPFPLDDKKDSLWVNQLIEPLPSSMDELYYKSTPVQTPPVEIDCVYETLDGKPWTRRMGMPEYDQVYQGF